MPLTFLSRPNPPFFPSLRPTASPDDLRTTHGKRKEDRGTRVGQEKGRRGTSRPRGGRAQRPAHHQRTRDQYGVRSGTKSILRKHFFASKIVLRVIVCCLRGVGFMSSSRHIPRFIVLFFFGAPLAFLRGVAMGLCRRCVIFMSSCRRVCLSSTALHTWVGT